ncbi:hypothetical protein [Actinosynnema mirum]|uniref:Uncharacterized protein n=1 Tax=Actinosynnema mirum (strain ATCC 29888 / DSM 43827 / JCM 3225 / NBRC 14064 / NCIMB 13271 / NRRL B-12336 / IMRU 3971 / 101) TaxID=446462 RepID=C6WBL8_ACTMD|nr:hypothetical protein [Actinosynnema mirum]ACU35586.1 hypothetical protein Amir_1637 [Actinosynnema mirum DSM 43827]
MVSLLGGLVPAPSTVQHRAALLDDGDGARWAAPVDVPGCRVETVSKRAEVVGGRVVTLAALVWMPALPEVNVGDLLVVDGQERPVEVVDAPVWLSGQRMHHEVWTT